MITNKEFWHLLAISKTKNSKPMSFDEVSKIMGIQKTCTPIFGKIKKMLIELKIAQEKQTFGRAKLLIFDIKKLDEFIRNTEQFNNFAEYIKTKNRFYNI